MTVYRQGTYLRAAISRPETPLRPIQVQTSNRYSRQGIQRNEVAGESRRGDLWRVTRGSAGSFRRRNRG